MGAGAIFTKLEISRWQKSQLVGQVSKKECVWMETELKHHVLVLADQKKQCFIQLRTIKSSKKSQRTFV